MYCFNRPSEIWLWSRSDNSFTQLSSLGCALRGLHFSNSRLYFLRTKVGGSHFNASDFCSVKVDGSDLQVHGRELFCQKFTCSGDQIYFNVSMRSSRHVYHFDTNTNILKDLNEHCDKEMCFDYLCNDHDFILLRATTPIQQHYLVAIIDDVCTEINLSSIGYNVGLAKELKSACYSIYRMHDYADIVLTTPSSHNGGVVLLSHGGPNSVYPAEFNIYTAALCLAGYAVAAINYTGSIGYSQEAVSKLEGKIGEMDLEDMMAAVEILKRQIVSSTKFFLFGGSHGGYISALLTAKHPEIFAGCILRNPVTDLPSMSYSTDILDWTFGQLGFEYSQNRPKPLTEEQLLIQLARSPSHYVQDVKTPTMIILGEQDCRVAPFQGRVWNTWLKANGVRTSLLSFPDAGHALDTAESEKYSLLAILSFFDDLLKEAS